MSFFRSLFEEPVGPTGPNGPAMAIDKRVYVRHIERTLDELQDFRSTIHTYMRQLRIKTGRLDVGVIVDALGKNARLEACLHAI